MQVVSRFSCDCDWLKLFPNWLQNISLEPLDVLEAMADNAELLGPLGMIRRSELVRMIAQCLYSLGYSDAASRLETESGISCKSEEFKLLETQVMAGNWDVCSATLGQIDRLTSESREEAMLYIFLECLLESLHEGGPDAASDKLRDLVNDFDIVQESFVKLLDELTHPNEVEWARLRANGVEYMRWELVLSLEELMPPPVVLPGRTLERLVEIALTTQASNFSVPS